MKIKMEKLAQKLKVDHVFSETNNTFIALC